MIIKSYWVKLLNSSTHITSHDIKNWTQFVVGVFEVNIFNKLSMTLSVPNPHYLLAVLAELAVLACKNQNIHQGATFMSLKFVEIQGQVDFGTRSNQAAPRKCFWQNHSINIKLAFACDTEINPKGSLA